MLTNISNEPLCYLDIDTLALPDVILYPNSGIACIMTGDMPKSFKMESEVSYLDDET